MAVENQAMQLGDEVDASDEAEAPGAVVE